MKSVRALSVVLAAVALAGCGQDSAGSSTAAPELPAGSYTGRLALFGAESDRATSGVLVIDLATGEQVRASDGREAWSAAWGGPDHLAVVSGPPRISAQGEIGGQLALTPADGSGKSSPIGDVADVTEVASSADGQHLAFLGRTSTSSRACAEPPPEDPLGLYLAAGDGAGVRRVADVPTTATSLALSPDGATAAMLDQGDESAIPAGGDWCGSGDARLVLIDTATGAARAVAGMPQIIERPRFSPDGATIVVAGGDFATNPARDLVFIDVATATARRVETPDTSESSPVFSPDGAQLAVLRPTQGAGGPGSPGSIAVGRADATGWRTVAATGTEDQDLVWTPDGSALVVAGATVTPACGDGGADGGSAMGGCDVFTATSDVRIADVEEGQLRQVTATVSGEANLAFAP